MLYMPRIIIMGVCVKIFVMLGSSVYNLINSVLVFSNERARQNADCMLYMPRIIIMCVCVKVFVMLGSNVNFTLIVNTWAIILNFYARLTICFSSITFCTNNPNSKSSIICDFFICVLAALSSHPASCFYSFSNGANIRQL